MQIEKMRNQAPGWNTHTLWHPRSSSVMLSTDLIEWNATNQWQTQHDSPNVDSILCFHFSTIPKTRPTQINKLTRCHRDSFNEKNEMGIKPVSGISNNRTNWKYYAQLLLCVGHNETHSLCLFQLRKKCGDWLGQLFTEMNNIEYTNYILASTWLLYLEAIASE